MTIANEAETAVSVEELDEAQSREMFERACQRELGVGAGVFLAAYDTDDIPVEWDERAVQRLEFLLPFAR